MNHLEVWGRFQAMQHSDLPREVAQVAGQCILDWFGCATAGSREPLAQILREEFAERQLDVKAAQGGCTVIGADFKLDARTAALLNGASGHALDYDDTGSTVLCHSTAPVFPAALAVAEQAGASGKELITAFVVGVEVLGRVAQMMGSNHYGIGWHTTATYGTFGATAAAAHLLKLDEAQYAAAMGLAASHASGVKANFGTMTKPYHAGAAAEKGVNCARLALKGFTANPDAVAGNQGFIRAASNVAEKTAAEKTVAEKTEKTEETKRQASAADDWMIKGTLFKYHAACHLTHAAIESVLALKTSLDASDLSALTITVHPGLLDVCGIPEPKTGLEGKFSLRGTAALALEGLDTADPRTFMDEVICRDDIQQRIPHISVETDRSLANMQSRVTWVDKQQNRHEQHWDVGVPATDLAEQGEKLTRKFNSLCDLAGVDGAHLAKQLDGLAESPSVNLG